MFQDSLTHVLYVFQPHGRLRLSIASPCEFLTYDSNQDGKVTGDEIRLVVKNDKLADKIIKELDSCTGTYMYNVHLHE